MPASYYADKEPTCKVSILGTEYGIYIDVPEDEDEILQTGDGYCDQTSKRIVICERCDDCNLDDFEAYQKNILRHEIIHAFLFESGLNGNSVWHNDGQNHPEQTVEWFAYQFPKILKVFQDVGAI